MWRAAEASYDSFGEHLRRAGGFPTYLPWPMASGWQVTDFGVVVGGTGAVATVASVAGVSPLDGPVEVTMVSEEPATGLGSRCAGTVHSDPGAEIGAEAPSMRVRVDGQVVPLWLLPMSGDDAVRDRAVAAGEAHGRWLWLVVTPASALLLLREDWLVADVSGVGAPLLELPFGGPRASW
ncbi:hypothetical protein ncot_14345 [Nocardioides sp. JQ2195]|nr:hypothetical protein ncot_14345 [Nocardioides sp. JQ2195]